MATIQKIRSYGVVLIAVVGIALFAFIAEELVRAVSTTRNLGRQVIGEVYGENVNYQEFNELFTEYENVVKMSNGGQNLTEAQTIQMRDQIWNSFLQQKTIEHEAAALGLRVTDAEVQSIITTGSSPVLRNTPFVNQQTGMFDVNLLNQFLTNYEEIMGNPEYPEQQKDYFRQMMNYWKFMEKEVRNQALYSKYNTLLSSCLLTNPVSVQAEVEARANESTILMAALPLSTVKDITATDSEIKAKYEEMKKQYPDAFDMQDEARDISYILVPINASQADKDALEAELAEYRDSLQAGNNIANVVRESRSLVTYNGLPVSKTSLPRDIAAAIDTLAPGTFHGPFTNTQDNTMNVIAYLAKQQLPDSVEFSRIVVAGVDAKATATADSILNALQAGAPIDTIAKKYNQSAAPQWITSAQVDGSQLSIDDRSFVETILNTPAGVYKKVTTAGANIIIKVTDRRNIIDKYQVAVIKRTIDFSDETRNNAWNKFSSFLAANPKAEDVEANAQQEGYTVMPAKYVSSSDHYIANTPSTTDALRWVFDKAKKGEVSELYDCGTANDHLLVVMLNEIHPKGARDINDEMLKAELEDRVVRDKQAAALMEKMQNAKSVAEVAKMEGAVKDTINNITFASPVYVQKLGAQEYALSGAVTGAKKGDFVSGVRGNNAVYAFQVLNTEKQKEADKEQVEAQLKSRYSSSLNGVMNLLRRHAKVVDKRYKFYQ